VLNSGSAMLALSFDRPVLVPRQGALEELRQQVGSDWVRTYTGELAAPALEEAVEWATRLPAGAVAPLERFSWDRIATATIEVYRQVLSPGVSDAGRN
jgi:hypothetical protein